MWYFLGCYLLYLAVTASAILYGYPLHIVAAIALVTAAVIICVAILVVMLVPRDHGR